MEMGGNFSQNLEFGGGLQLGDGEYCKVFRTMGFFAFCSPIFIELKQNNRC